MMTLSSAPTDMVPLQAAARLAAPLMMTLLNASTDMVQRRAAVALAARS